MASSSRVLCVGLVVCLVWLAAGCATGRLYERGRIREKVVAYHEAYSDGERLLVHYSVELSDAGGAPIGRERRTVSLPIAALEARPALPVDAFPVERADLERDRVANDRPVALEIISAAEGPEGFRICSGEAGSCEGRFHSGALYRDRTAWWVYPVVPFSAAVDAVLFVPQLVATSPFFLFGD